MNLSARLCDVTIGEYIAATQSAGIASTLVYTLAATVALMIWKRWQARKMRKVFEAGAAAAAAARHPADAEFIEHTTGPTCEHMAARDAHGLCYPCWRAWRDAGKPEGGPPGAPQVFRMPDGRTLCVKCGVSVEGHDTPGQPCPVRFTESGQSPPEKEAPTPVIPSEPIDTEIS